MDEADKSHHDWLTPDVLVAPASSLAPNLHCLPPATLAVEILSRGQTLEQMYEKAARYFKCGVSYVWIIDPYEKNAVVLDCRIGVRRIIPAGSPVLLKADWIRLTLDEIFSFEV
jgi:Uma2 family endonuclease